MLNNRIVYGLGLALLLFVIAGCGGQAIPDLPPEEIVSNSVARMREMQGFKFIIDRSGAFAYLDLEETISFGRAEGDYSASDSVSASVKILVVPLLVSKVDLIAIGDSQWQTNPLSGEWEVIPPGSNFNPSALFHPETGIQAALANDLSEMELIGVEELEEVPGQQLYALSGKLAGQRAYQMSFGLIGPDELQVTMWIAPSTFELYRLVIVEPGVDEEDDTIWQIDFWNFDQVSEITPPIP